MTRQNTSLDFRFDLQPCAYCGGLEFHVLARQDRHALKLQTVGCGSCGLVQINPRPDKPRLTKFYATEYRRYYQGVTDPSEKYVAALNKDKRLEYTVRYLQGALGLSERSRILDYGCGEGSLFIALRKAGFIGGLFGVELDQNFARFAQLHGKAVVSDKLDDFRELDGAVINHVLEHLPDPVELLARIATALKPNGMLYIDVPDVEEYTHTTDLHIAHLLHFSERTLRALVQKAGYEVLSCEKHSPPFHPRSVRLLACVSSNAADPVKTSPDTEGRAWTALRRIAKREWRWTLRKRLADVRLVAVPYRYARLIYRGIRPSKSRG